MWILPRTASVHHSATHHGISLHGVSIYVVGTGAALLCEVAAYLMISPIHTVIIGNLSTVLNLILQYTILGDNLYGRRNALEVVGCVLIVTCMPLSGMFNNDEKHEDF